MSIGSNVSFVPGAVLGAADQAVEREADVERAADGEPVGRSDRDADIRRTRQDSEESED